MDKREFTKIVGQNMKKYREQHGLTQEKFAEKAGISLSFCAAVETARKAPSAFTLRTMADKLGVTVDYYFMYQDSPQTNIKSLSAQLLDREPRYIDFIERLVTVCNDYSDRDRK